MTEPAFFYTDESGQAHDAGLHAEMLDNPEMDDWIARKTITLATEKGMSLGDAVSLYGTDPIRNAFEKDGTDPRIPPSGISGRT